MGSAQGGPRRQQPDQPRQLGQPGHVGQIAHLALQHRVEIAVEPALSACAAALHGLGEPPRFDPSHQTLAVDRHGAPGEGVEVSGEQSVEKALATTLDLPLGQWPQPQHLHPPREGVGNSRQAQHIGRTGEDEAA
jgi:hypothetical protein